ncbi:MAG TPA: ATP-binding cassette domain-containing protein, partial [Acholeplasma sp.]|nr:ATP-binding cassette domain-containing protein [Acholeplasma sp.]
LEDLKYGFITKDKARQKITEIMNQYNLHVDLDEYVKNLTVGEQQKVEILKMLYRNSDILIFDEPTAVLTPQEIDELIEIMKGFAKEGKTVILITHKLEEIKRAANKCTILRRGKVIDTVDVKSVTKNQLAEMMVGRVLNQKYEFNEYQPKEKVLSLKNVTLKGKSKDILKDISFDVHKGEILGIAGIDGNGQTELVQVITGMMRHTSGEIILNNEYAKDLVQKYDIRSAAGINSSARSMSGGNQQKAIVAREIEKPHDLLIAFQPTRGLDVGAINNIHQQMIKERNNDKAVLLVSFELEEIFSLSDRILVIFEGQIVGEFLRGQVDEETIGLYMSGTRKEVE